MANPELEGREKRKKSKLQSLGVGLIDDFFIVLPISLGVGLIKGGVKAAGKKWGRAFGNATAGKRAGASDRAFKEASRVYERQTTSGKYDFPYHITPERGYVFKATGGRRKVRKGWEWHDNGKLHNELSSRGLASIGGAGASISGWLEEYLSYTPSLKQAFYKHVPDLGAILEHGTGMSIYGKVESLDELKAVKRHETWHRALDKRANEVGRYDPYIMGGESYLKSLLSEEDYSIIKSIFPKELGTAADETYAYMFMRSSSSPVELHDVLKEAARKDPIVSSWIDEKTNRLNYFKMKKYLNEPTGAAAVIRSKAEDLSIEMKASALSQVMKKHVRIGATNPGVVQDLHGAKIGHNIKSLGKKLSGVARVISRAK
jgi:hypothetical protein